MIEMMDKIIDQCDVEVQKQLKKHYADLIIDYPNRHIDSSLVELICEDNIDDIAIFVLDGDYSEEGIMADSICNGGGYIVLDLHSTSSVEGNDAVILYCIKE